MSNAIIHRDHSECLRSEEALQECREFLQDCLDNSNDLIQSLAPDGHFLLVNRKWRERLGYGDDEVSGLSILDLVHPICRIDFELVWQRLRSGAATEGFESLLVARDGKSIPVYGIAKPHFAGGKTTAVLLIFRDLSEQTSTSAAAMKPGDRAQQSLPALQRPAQDAIRSTSAEDLLLFCESAEEISSIISYYMPLIFPGLSGALYVVAQRGGLLETAATWGDGPAKERVLYPHDCWGLRLGRLHIVEGPDSPLCCRHLGQSKPASYICLPLMARGEVVGMLHLQAGDSGAGKILGEDTQRHAIEIADRVALALASLRLRDNLQKHSIRDPLTDLYNRGHMQQSIEKELRRAARRNRSLGIIMIDIDHFQDFNDSFGYDAGNLMLREFSKTLTSLVRGEDIACRYGGEEFLLILPEASLEITSQRAEQLRKEFKTLKLRFQGHGFGALSLSIGVAAFPDNGANSDTLIRAADSALLSAKAEGRNRVAIAPTMKGN